MTYAAGNAAPLMAPNGAGMITYRPYPVPGPGQNVAMPGAPPTTALVSPQGRSAVTGAPPSLYPGQVPQVAHTGYYFASWGQHLAPPGSQPAQVGSM